MTIQKMTQGHIDDVVKIEQECFVHPWSKQSLEAELYKKGAHFYIACEDEKAVGYIGLNTVLDEGYITNVAVLPKYRKKGIAKALLGRIIEVAKEENLSFITLEVRKSNQKAIYLYKTFGFEMVGARKSFYTEPSEDALLLTKYFK